MKSKKVKLIFHVLIWICPSSLRRLLYCKFFKYEIHRSAKIGRCLILADQLIMKEGTAIKNFNFINDIDLVSLEAYSQIDKNNWITGLSTKYGSNFTYDFDRKCFLELGEHTRVTSHHTIDCTGGVSIGKFTTIAGTNTEILTHQIDIEINRQRCSSVEIGDYCMIGTKAIILMGSKVPSYCVLGAGSLLNKAMDDEYALYAGVPAKKIKILSQECSYFSRKHGHVN